MLSDGRFELLLLLAQSMFICLRLTRGRPA